MVTYADRPWTKKYDPHVPETLAPYPDYALTYHLAQAVKNYPDRPALVTSLRLPSVLGMLGRLKTEVTYKELDVASDALAAALVKMGIQKGDRVAVIMPNMVAFVISFWAILKAGAVITAMNPTYPAEKMKHLLQDSDARLVLTISLAYDTVKEAQPGTLVEKVIVANIKEYFPGLAKLLFTWTREKQDGHYVAQLAAGDEWFQDVLNTHRGKSAPVEVKGDDVALFQYTGGTTGVPKAAVSKHKAMVANALQCESYLQTSPDDSFLGAIPMFHVFGMLSVLCFATVTQTPIYLIPNPRDINDVTDAIDTFKPTMFMGVPALYNAIRLNEQVQRGKYDLTSIRACISGSAPLAPITKTEFERLSGGSLMEGYGMSETPTATIVNPLNSENRTGSIGLPLPDVNIRIVSLEDGVTDVPVGEPGELLINAPQMMIAYHKMPTETANTLREYDGKTWLYTGDIAKMDEDGYIYLVDRKKDMALIGGFNVYPNMIEKVVVEHPAVAEAAVAAIPHPKKPGQEALKAWVVFKDGQSATEDDLIAYQEPHLAAYEVVRRFAFVDVLPKTPVGKVLRRELVRQETEGTQASTDVATA